MATAMVTDAAAWLLLAVSLSLAARRSSSNWLYPSASSGDGRFT